MKCITSNLKTLENMIISDVMLAIKRLPIIFNDWIHYVLRSLLVSCLSIGILLFFLTLTFTLFRTKRISCPFTISLPLFLSLFPSLACYLHSLSLSLSLDYYLFPLYPLSLSLSLFQFRRLFSFIRFSLSIPIPPPPPPPP